MISLYTLGAASIYGSENTTTASGYQPANIKFSGSRRQDQSRAPVIHIETLNEGQSDIGQNG